LVDEGWMTTDVHKVLLGGHDLQVFTTSVEKAQNVQESA
jgi:hypothetical protein